MKKKDKYKIFNYAKEQYSKDFNRNYAFKHLSKKELYKLLEKTGIPACANGIIVVVDYIAIAGKNLMKKGTGI